MSSIPVTSVCFDWGGTLMSEAGPQDRPMCRWPDVEVVEGALDCVRALQGSYTLCVATNAMISNRSEIRSALDRVDLGKYFTHIFCYAEIGFKKNQRQFWLAVQQTLGHPLEQIALIGDSLEHDVVAPASFGIQTYWFNENGRKPAPATAVSTVTKLHEFAVALMRPNLTPRSLGE